MSYRIWTMNNNWKLGIMTNGNGMGYNAELTELAWNQDCVQSIKLNEINNGIRMKMKNVYRMGNGNKIRIHHKSEQQIKVDGG